MVIITKTVLNEFGAIHPEVASAMNEWYSVVCDASWRTFADIKQTFNSVDYVGNTRYVFNIKGNKY